MSNFEGQYFRYDVGLVNDDAEYIEDVTPLNKTCKLVTFTAETGTLNSVELLEFTVNGKGPDDKNNMYVITYPQGSEESYTGSYNIRAKLSYTTTNNQQITKIHTFSIPFNNLAYTIIRSLYGNTRCGPFPMSNEFEFALTGEASEMNIKIQFHAFALFPYIINGVEINEVDHTLTFPCGFDTEAYDSTNHSFDVDINYTSCNDGGEMLFNGSFDNNGVGTFVSSIDYANVDQIIVTGTISSSGDNKSFNIAANSEIKFNCTVVSFNTRGFVTGHHEGPGMISARIGSSPISLPIKEYESGFQFSFSDWIDLITGDYSLGSISLQDISTQSVTSYNLNTLHLSIHAGDIIFKLDESDTYIGKVDGFFESRIVEGSITRPLYFYTALPVGPQNQMEIRFTPADDDEEESEEHIVRFMKGKATTVGFKGEVSNNKITVSMIEIEFENVVFETNHSERTYTHLQYDFNLLEPAEFSVEGDENNRLIIRVNENMLVKIESGDFITTGIYDGLYFPSGTVIPLKFYGIVDEEKAYMLDSGRLWSYSDGDFVNYRAVPIFWDVFMNSNKVDFLACNSEDVKTSTTAISANKYVYEKLMASGRVLDHTTDAGYVIPVVNNGCYVKKYVRISDLYDEIVSYEREKYELPPALGDRLHACEVALDETCSGTLEDGVEADASRLYNIKNKWCVVDIQGLA